MKNLYVNKRFCDPAVLLRYPLIESYNHTNVSIIEESPIVDHSVYILERFCLENLYEYITKNQLLSFASLSDGNLLFIEDFTLPIKSTVNHVVDLVKIFNFNPKNIWFNIAWNHQKEEFENALIDAGIYGVNIRVHNCYLREIYNQYIENQSFFENMEENLEKRFSIFARRYHDDRLSLFLKLINEDILNQCEYTFTNFSPEMRAYPDPWITKKELKNLPIVKAYSEKQCVIDPWIDGLPYCLDVNDLRQSFPLEIYRRYNRAGINIVMETVPCHRNDIHVQDIMITEKTYKAIVSQKPFILYAPSGSLELLKKEGFRTFDLLIDESYDKTDIIKVKQNMIVSQLKKFSKLTDAEYFIEIENCADITRRNLRKFLNLGKQSNDFSIYTELGLIQPKVTNRSNTNKY